jgi:L-amino acid N-acyltransferase YncA
LGFLPSQAYEEAARKGTLFVAVDVTAGNLYAGHILFGDTYPHARIYQTFVHPDARKFGVGRKLVESLVRFAETRQYLSVAAKVALELPANGFYESLGFETLRTKPGGSSRGRTINIRVRQLNTPALFGYREPVSGVPLAEPIPTFTPVFSIDLNVFFDVAKRRARSELGGLVISASFSNLVRLTVTDEFVKELQRSSSGGSDPVLEFALQLPTLPPPPGGVSDDVLKELAAIVFPRRAAAGSLTPQDRSDLIHLAIAAHHKVTGFVTAEDALVDASSILEDKFGIRVVHVRNLAELLRNSSAIQSPLEIGFSEADLRLSEVDGTNVASIETLADSLKLPQDVRALVTRTGIHVGNRKSLAVSLGGEVVCAAFWQAHSTLYGKLDAVLLADEDQASSEVALDALLYRLSRIATASGPARIQLVIPNGCLSAQRVAARCGFMRCSDASNELSRFQRLSIGSSITQSSWPGVRRELSAVADMLFPEILPTFLGGSLRIGLENKQGKQFEIDLYDLETSLSPTVFLLSGRPGVLVPIKPSYANELLGTSEQGFLFTKHQAVVLHERTYFCASRNVKLFEKGAVVVFYESGKANGRSAAVAVARVKISTVVSKRKISPSLIECGVLDEQELSEITAGEQLAAITFDNVMKLKRPVGLNKLRELGCVDGSNAVTSRGITPNQLQRVIEEGQGTSE